jgi:polyhydroxyalkanoate synthesis regulator phasin
MKETFIMTDPQTTPPTPHDDMLAEAETPVPPLAQLRPTAYRLFLAGIGLAAVTQDRLTNWADRWIAYAEDVEAQRAARVAARLQSRVSGPTEVEQALVVYDDTAVDETIVANIRQLDVSTRQDIDALSQRLDDLLDQLEEVAPDPSIESNTSAS